MQIWLEKLTLKTQEIVNNYWIYIEKLANILIEKKQVDRTCHMIFVDF